MQDGRKRLGDFGERLAAHHLEAKGYRIVARNWRCARGEIDLVAQAGAELVFVEVKTRRGQAFGAPEQGVTPRKAQRLLELGQRLPAGPRPGGRGLARGPGGRGAGRAGQTAALRAH